MWPRISQHILLLRASRQRVVTRSLASLDLNNRAPNMMCTRRSPQPNQFTLNSSWRSFTSSDSSFHGITLPEDGGKVDQEALQYNDNPMIQEAEVVKSDEDKRKIRESIAEVVRAELSAYSTPKQDHTQIDAEGEENNALEGYERLLHMLNNAQARHDNMEQQKTNTLEYTQSMMNLGALHYQLGNMEQSQDMYMSALKQSLANSTDDGGGMMVIAQCMHSLGAVHARCGEFDEAFRWYEESLKRKNEIIRERSNSKSINSYHFELGKTYNALAALQTMRGGVHWREAMSMFQLAERHQLHDHLGDDEHGNVLGMEGNKLTKQLVGQLTPHHVQSIVNIRFNVGKLLQQHAHYDDAVDTFRAALDLARLDVERMTTDDVKGHDAASAVGHPTSFERKNAVVELLVQIADCFASTQNYDEAAQAYEEALGYHIFFRRWKGNSYESKGQESSCLPAISATNTKLDITNATTMEAAIRSNLARALAHIGQEKLGLEHYEASLKIKRQIGGNDHVEVAHTLMGMGAVYGGPLRDFSTALNCFKEALYIYRHKMNELTDDNGISGSNKFFDDDEAEELDGHIQNAVKNIGLIEAALLKDREDGIIKKRR